MTVLYVSPSIPIDSYVTITTYEPIRRLEWITNIRMWVELNNLDVKWAGETTFIESNVTWHKSTWSILDEHERSMFLLRWS